MVVVSRAHAVVGIELARVVGGGRQRGDVDGRAADHRARGGRDPQGRERSVEIKRQRRRRILLRVVGDPQAEAALRVCGRQDAVHAAVDGVLLHMRGHCQNRRLQAEAEPDAADMPRHAVRQRPLRVRAAYGGKLRRWYHLRYGHQAAQDGLCHRNTDTELEAVRDELGLGDDEISDLDDDI